MQKCGYCGRQNPDDERYCGECGTELTAETQFQQSDQPATETPPPINLEQIESTFTTHEGFSRPYWPVILRALRQHHAEARLAAWLDVVSQWASRWKGELGNNYQMTHSGAFFLVSTLDAETAGHILQEANWLAEKIRSVLGPLGWQDRPYILIVQVPDEPLARRFDEAVAATGKESYSERIAARHAPSWALICGQDETVMTRDIQSVLEWNALDHLPLPYWLHCGVDAQLRRVIDSARSSGTAREIFDADLIPEHRRFWNTTTIQSFWAGTGETEYPEQFHLFYDLSKILVELLVEERKSLVDFLRCAHFDDAGESAAQVCFKAGLGELAGTFLGPGHWTPDPVAIAECRDRT